jgi:hypothetical protein
MSSGYANWRDVRAKGREADPRTAWFQADGQGGPAPARASAGGGDCLIMRACQINPSD